MGDNPAFLAIFDSLRDLGFHRHASRIHTLDISSEKLGWLGLNTASRKRPTGETLLYPVVGVRDQVIERHVAAGQGRPFHRYLPPTVSVPLRSLLPAGPAFEWVLGRSEDSDTAVVDDLADCLLRYAMPYYAQQSDPHEMATTLEAMWVNWQDSAYRWPIALWMLGDSKAADGALTKVVASLGRRDDLAAREVREFAECIRAQLTGLD
jgi:hypothetical protein